MLGRGAEPGCCGAAIPAPTFFCTAATLFSSSGCSSHHSIQYLSRGPKDLSRLCAVAPGPFSTHLSNHSSLTLSRKAKGTWRPKASSATTRKAAHDRARTGGRGAPGS